MRTILNISLPEVTVLEIKQSVKKKGFASVSEYVRHLVREEKERELTKRVLQSRIGFEQGKGKVLRSLKNLR
jgi:Arc/MetJ-type ribon-helix-helix transcriptional regulator